MTKKHFEIIARLFAECRAESREWTVSQAIDALAGDLALVFAELNPRFDVDRFLEAANREV